jgi:hypothetical protein
MATGKRVSMRGKGRPKTANTASQHWLIDIVFATRYRGERAPTWLPTEEGQLARKPGTVDGYRLVKGRLAKAKADCNVDKACRVAEQAFELKREVRRWWEISVNPETGERVRQPLIAKRDSDGVMEDGTATRQRLYRALAAERKKLKLRAWEDWDQIPRLEWIEKKKELAAKKARRRI